MFWIVLLVQEFVYGMDGFCTYGVSSCNYHFVILVIACNYLPTQDTSALISRVAFFWLRALHFWAMSAFRETWERCASILCCALFTSTRKNGRLLAGQSLICSSSGSWDSICSKIFFILLESSTRAVIGADRRSLMIWSWCVKLADCCRDNVSAPGTIRPIDAGSKESKLEMSKLYGHIWS